MALGQTGEGWEGVNDGGVFRKITEQAPFSIVGRTVGDYFSRNGTY